jgi:hypothetical protein
VKRSSPAILGAAAIAALWMCGAAIAARAPTEVSVSRTATANDQTVVDAKCPHGKHPVSGGFELEPGDNAFAANSAEGVDLKRKRWSLTTVSAGGSTRVTSHAYCSRLGRNIEFRSDRTDLNQGDDATITATCWRGEKVLSGGYAFVSSGLALGVVEESFRADPRSWSIRGTNFGENEVTMLAFAHCVPKKKAPKLTAAKGTVPFDDEGGPTTVSADCGPGRYALSGGYRITGNEPAFMVESRRAGARGWTVTDGGGIAGRADNLIALAYCARKR